MECSECSEWWEEEWWEEEWCVSSSFLPTPLECSAVSSLGLDSSFSVDFSSSLSSRALARSCLTGLGMYPSLATRETSMLSWDSYHSVSSLRVLPDTAPAAPRFADPDSDSDSALAPSLGAGMRPPLGMGLTSMSSWESYHRERSSRVRPPTGSTPSLADAGFLVPTDLESDGRLD